MDKTRFVHPMRRCLSKLRFKVLPALLLVLFIAYMPHLNSGQSMEESREGGGCNYSLSDAHLSITSTDDRTIYPLYTYNLSFLFKSDDLTELNITFSHSRYSFTIFGGFLRSFTLDLSEAKMFITVPQESVELHTQGGSWLLNFSFIPHWEMASGNYSLNFKIKNSTGGSKEYMFHNALYLSKKITIYWKGDILNEKGEDVTGKWVKGREKITLKSVRLYHLKESGNVSFYYPRIRDFNITLLSSQFTSWRWSFDDTVTSSGVFDLPFITPIYTGAVDLKLSLDNLPNGAELTGDVPFKIYIDSKPPTVLYSGYETGDGFLLFSFEVEDLHSGVDELSISSTVYRIDNDSLLPLPGETSYHSGTLDVSVRNADAGRYFIETAARDYAGNTAETNVTVLVGGDEYYDIALEEIRLLGLPIFNSSVRGEVTVRNMGDALKGGQITVWLGREAVYTKSLPSLAREDVIRYTFSFLCPAEEQILKAEVRTPKGIEDINPENNQVSMVVKGIFADLEFSNATAVKGGSGVMVNATIHYSGVEGLSSVEYQLFYDQILIDEGRTGPIQPGGDARISLSIFPSQRYSVIRLVLDPGDDIPESNEENNEISLPNPSLIEPVEEGPPGDQESPEEPQEENPAAEVGMEENNTPPGEEEPQQENLTGKPGEEEAHNTGNTEGTAGSEDVVVVPDLPDEESGGGGAQPLLTVTEGAIALFLLLEIFRRETLKYRLLTLFFPLYSKLKREKIESGTRWEIIGYLKAKPYASFSEIKRDLNLTNGTLIHHLRILEREDLVRSRKVGKYKLFYSVEKRLPEELNYLSPVKRKIIEYLMDNPGAIQKNIAKLLGKSITDLNYHLNELYRMGLIKKKKDGKYVRFYPI